MTGLEIMAGLSLEERLTAVYERLQEIDDEIRAHRKEAKSFQTKVEKQLNDVRRQLDIILNWSKGNNERIAVAVKAELARAKLEAEMMSLANSNPDDIDTIPPPPKDAA